MCSHSFSHRFYNVRVLFVSAFFLWPRSFCCCGPARHVRGKHRPHQRIRLRRLHSDPSSRPRYVRVRLSLLPSPLNWFLVLFLFVVFVWLYSSLATHLCSSPLSSLSLCSHSSSWSSQPLSLLRSRFSQVVFVLFVLISVFSSFFFFRPVAGFCSWVGPSFRRWYRFCCFRHYDQFIIQWF